MSEVVSPGVLWPAKVRRCKRFSVSGVCEKRERGEVARVMVEDFHSDGGRFPQ
jgi:hypothetical protein